MSRRLLVLLAFLPLSACADITDPTNGTTSKEHSTAASIEGPDAWSCTDPEDPHCLPPSDPCPECSGIYVDFGLTLSQCTGMQINDVDVDGLDDWCEWTLARSFRPRLMTSPSDADLSREPYWAARLYSENGSNCFIYASPCYSPVFVQLFYALSYHRDPGGTFEAYSHRGDSEFVVLWVSFDQTETRWRTVASYTSAHYSAYPDYSRLNYYDEMEYESNYAGYPDVWVSKNKHANYATQGRCDIGGIASIDDCSGNAPGGRIEVESDRNLGSAQVHMVNTVASITPSAYPRQENFWTADEFCGWMESWQFPKDCSEPYKWWLSDWGY